MQSNYLKNADAEWFIGVSYPSPPTNLFFCLYLSEPDLDGTGEILFSERLLGSTFSALETVGFTRQFSIEDILTFVGSPVTGNITHWGCFDSITSGNFIGSGKFVDEFGNPDPIIVVTGENVTINPGTIKFGYSIEIFSQYLIDAKLNWITGNSFLTAPSVVYGAVGYNLGTDGSGLYLPVNRQPIDFSSVLTAGLYKRINNDTDLIFDPLSEDSVINALAFYDSITSGNLLAVGKSRQKTVLSGNTPKWFAKRINLDF